MAPSVQSSGPAAAFGIDPTLLEKAPVRPTQAVSGTQPAIEAPVRPTDAVLGTQPAIEMDVEHNKVIQNNDDTPEAPVQDPDVVGHVVIAANGGDDDDEEDDDDDDGNGGATTQAPGIVGRHPSNANPIFGWVEGVGRGAFPYGTVQTMTCVTPYF